MTRREFFHAGKVNSVLIDQKVADFGCDDCVRVQFLQTELFVETSREIDAITIKLREIVDVLDGKKDNRSPKKP